MTITSEPPNDASEEFMAFLKARFGYEDAKARMKLAELNRFLDGLDKPERPTPDSEHQAEADLATALKQSTEILANFKTEGNRTKYDEMEACYAMLFSQMQPLMEENRRLKEQVASSEIPYSLNEFRISYFSNESGRAITQIVHLPTGQTLVPATEPVSVSLEKCANAIRKHQMEIGDNDPLDLAAVVLNVAGVKPLLLINKPKKNTLENSHD